jgi:protein-disulfide isomerase
MNVNDVPRLAAPVLLAAAIVLSAPHEPPPAPIDLPAGQLPPPPEGEVRAALAQAVTAGAPGFDRGVTQAPVTVLEFADFGCPYCGRFAEQSYPPLATEFVTTGRVRWRAIPFVLGMFPNGTEAARAGTCAGDQGPAAFGRMHDRLFARQEEWKRAADPAALFRSYAAALGLDGARFAACYAGHDADAALRQANALADRLGVRATPTFFIAGHRVEGALPAAQFREVLRAALGESHGH